ncbi:MAG TPA: SMP-30/gluconolactonase/LRE family protein [Caulobacteraceae bacterium]|jgi:sugar lactone lactonase YvrE
MIECVWDVGAELGEGPMWDARGGWLWFVDIKGRRVHRFEPATGARRSWDAPDQCSFILPIAGGGYACGLPNGVHRFDPDTGAFTLTVEVEPDRPGNRLNDGYVDATGHLWFGTMDDGESEATGSLYRLGAQGLQRMDDGYVITNGPAASPDGRTLYHVNTVERTLWAFDLGEDGTLANKRLFGRSPQGGADGPVVDVAGNLWLGLFGGWGLARYGPDGTLLDRAPAPCANVTKGCFGGEDLRTLYVTTAWKSLSTEARAEQPLAGGLFALPVETPGLPQHEIRFGL